MKLYKQFYADIFLTLILVESIISQSSSLSNYAFVLSVIIKSYIFTDSPVSSMPVNGQVARWMSLLADEVALNGCKGNQWKFILIVYW